MATADWCLWITIACTPLLEWTFERAYDALTSRSRRLWWMQHYRQCASAYIASVTAQRDFEAERAEFERFRQNCRAQVARWECNQYRMAA